MSRGEEDRKGGQQPHLIDETTRYPLDQFCEVCGVHRSVVRELVKEGVIQPENDREESWEFSFRAVKRFKRAYRLQRDLDLNMSGVVVSVDLLEEIDRLNSELTRLRIHLNAFGIGDPDTEQE